MFPPSGIRSLDLPQEINPTKGEKKKEKKRKKEGFFVFGFFVVVVALACGMNYAVGIDLSQPLCICAGERKTPV